MNRFFYSLLLYLATPLVVVKMALRARKASAYGKRWGERFGFFPALPKDKPVIWVHSVSVGETIASAPMVKALIQQYPEHRILITTMTPTGSDQVKALYDDKFGRQVEHIYCPYDLPDVQWRFFKKTNPVIALMIDTELWPNTIAACRKRNIPMIIVNARLSARSAKGYARFGSMMRKSLESITMVACQNKDDGQRFIDLGLPEEQLMISGSVKFDISVSDQIRQEGLKLRKQWESGLGCPAKILVAASTHEGEDQKVINAFKTLQILHKNLLLVLVPRHPERFDSVYDLIQKNRLNALRHSKGSHTSPETHVILGDTMGEMMKIYAASDIAFVGGSLIERGGHNMLEPAVLGLPILSGNHVFNFQDISDSLVKAGGMKLVTSSDELVKATRHLLEDRHHYQTMSKNAVAFIDNNRGALAKTLDIINQQLLKSPHISFNKRVLTKSLNE